MIFSQKRGWPLFFNFLFWTPFWLFPFSGWALRTGLRYLVSQIPSHLLASLLVTAGLAAMAELCGSRRRWFFLAAGLVCWVGAEVWTLFLFGSIDVINTYSIATVVQYVTGVPYIHINPLCVLPLAGATLPFLLLRRFWRRLDWPTDRLAASLGIVLALALIPIDRFRNHHGMREAGNVTPLYRIDLYLPGDTYYQLYRYISQMVEIGSYRNQHPLVFRSAREPLTLIVMVGESTTRSRMSLYGYCRQTTPQLEAMRDLAAFDNLISNIPFTLFTLRNILQLPSVATADGPGPATLLNLLSAAGFRTEWISNQYQTGGPADILTTLMSTAQIRVWSAQLHSEPHAAAGDAALLPWIAKTLDNPAPRQAAFFHMLGSHFDYKDRYPPAFARPWKPLSSARTPGERRVIDEYDTTVRYQDQLIRQAIRLAESHGKERNIALVYFSDHGEEVYQQYPFLLHAFPNSTRQMVEVPLLVWLSPALRHARPDLAAAVEGARHRRLQTRDVAPLLLDLASVRTAGDTLEHPLQPGFREGKRLVDTYDYDRDPNLGRTPVLAPLCVSRPDRRTNF
jgi:glucan phosphoethanolaminetransferase (alkaline phosphatase superfamily)